MTRLVAVSLAAILNIVLFVPRPVLAAVDSFKVQSWAQDLDKVPCSAFRQNKDGSWAPTAIIFVGGIRFKGTFAKGSPEAQSLGMRCSK